MVIIIVVLGVISVLNTDVDFLPDMDLPYVVVATVYAGQPAEIVEKEVTAVLEQALGSMSSVRSVSSMSYDNVSVISLQLDSGSDVDVAAEEIQGRIDGAALPNSAYLQESMVIKANPNMLPSMSVSVSRKGESVPDSSEYFAALADRIRAVDGVQDVSVQGLIDNYILLSLNDEKTADVLHAQVKDKLFAQEGQANLNAVQRFTQSLESNLSAALKELEDLSLADAASLATIMQNLAAFYDELNDWLAGDISLDKIGTFIDEYNGFLNPEKPNGREAAVSAASKAIDELLTRNDYSAAKIIIKSLYPETSDYAAVHINRLLLSSSTTGSDYGAQVANAAENAGEAVELIASAMLYISPDVFESVFGHISEQSGAASVQAIESNVAGYLLNSFGKDNAGNELWTGEHPYATVAQYVRAHTAEFAAALIEYTGGLGKSEAMGETTVDDIVAGAKKAHKNVSVSSIEKAICSALGYDDFEQLFAQLKGDETAEIYKKLTQTLSSVIDSDLIGTLLQAQDISLPAGSYTENGITYIVNVDGSINSLEDLIFMPATGINLLSLLTSSWGEADGILSFIASLLPSGEDGSPLEEPIVQEFLSALLNGSPVNFDKWDELEQALGIDTTLLEQWAANAYIDKDGSLVKLFNDAGWLTRNESGANVIDKESLSAFSDEFEKLTISLSLNDIADITVIDTSALVFSKLDGAHSITISVTKQAGYSGATLSDDLNALLESLTGEEEFSDLQYAVLYDDGHYTNELIDTVIENLLWGALLAVVILFIFLKDLRPTLLTALSMVISVVATFVIMYFAGISLNLMSMAGLAMGIGMLVDNSVVVIENIYRLRARGAPVKEAVVTGTSQMSGAILASTITSLIVWLPILFTQGLTKTVVKDMAITLCLSLAVSLVVAVTFVPSLAQYTVKNYRPREDKAMSAVKKAYSRSLSFTLRHKWITLVVVGVMLALAVTSFFFMDSRFFPETDTGSLTVNVSIDAVAVNSAKDEKGEKLSYEEVREEVCDKLFDYLSAMPESEHVNMTISSNVNIAGYNIEAEGLDVGADTISAMVKLKEGKRESAKQLCDKLTRELSSSLPYAQFVKAECSTGTVIDTAVASDNLTVNVYGDDLDALKEAVGTLSSSIARLDGVSYTSDNIGGSGISYTLQIDRDEAMKYGLTVGEIYLQLSKLLTDVTLTPATSLTVTEGEGAYDVFIYDYFYSLLTWHKGFKGEENVNIYYRDKYLKSGETYSIEREYYLIDKQTGDITWLLADKKENGALLYDENGYLSLNDGVYKADVSEEYFSDDSARGDILDAEISYTLNSHIGGVESGTVKLRELLLPSSFVDGNKDGELIAQEGMVSIDRKDGRRYSAVTVCLESGASANRVGEQIQALIDAYNSSHPDSALEIQFVKQTAEVEEIYNTLYIVLGVAIVLVYLVMAAQFGSLKTPFIIMFTIPLAFTGSLLLLFVTGVGISVVAVLGLIMLMGVVVNNGIIFVELTDKLVKEGLEKRTALITAGATRLRPILITALTTIVGLIITACDGSATGRMLQPMAITSIGGLLYATIVTLFFIPVIYDLFKRKRKGEQSPEPAPEGFDPDKLLAETEEKYDDVSIEELPEVPESKLALLFKRLKSGKKTVSENVGGSETGADDKPHEETAGGEDEREKAEPSESKEGGESAANAAPDLDENDGAQESPGESKDE